MLFNPITNTLYTNDNKLIKNMHCPYSSLSWNDLSPVGGGLDQLCAICDSNVVDTAEYNDEALLQLLKTAPETCLKVDFNQKNVSIVHHI